MSKYAGIYAVDFDGTLCRNKWPEIGEPNDILLGFLKEAREQGSKVVLWTMREGDMQEQAVAWCRNHGLEFDAVNDNTAEMKEFYGNNPRKVFANVYIDDHNWEGTLWPFQGLPEPHGDLIDREDARGSIKPWSPEDEMNVCTFDTVKKLMHTMLDSAPTIIPASEKRKENKQ